MAGQLVRMGLGPANRFRGRLQSRGWDSVVATNGSDPVQIYYYGRHWKFTDMITCFRCWTTMLASHVAVLGRHIVLAGHQVLRGSAPNAEWNKRRLFSISGRRRTCSIPISWCGVERDDETTFGDEVAFPGENTSWQPCGTRQVALPGLAQAGDKTLLIFKEHLNLHHGADWKR